MQENMLTKLPKYAPITHTSKISTLKMGVCGIWSLAPIVPVLWHLSQVIQNVLASLNNVGQ